VREERLTQKVTKTTAKKVARFALDKKAFHVDLMDLRKITPVTDFFIICSGSTDVHVKAIADSVIENCKKDGISVYHVEGYESKRWVLIDLVEIVVHVFQPEVRGYYQLERLWGDAPTDKFAYEDSDVV
jgi:ribosome-associated protein